MSTPVASFHARAGLDVSEFVKGTTNMSESLRKAVTDNKSDLEAMDSRFQKVFLDFARASEKPITSSGLSKLIRQFNELDEASKLAFAQASRRVEQMAMLDPNRGLTRRGVEGARARGAAELRDNAIAQATEVAQLEQSLLQKRLSSEQAAAEQAMAAEKQRLERRARVQQSFDDLRRESAQQTAAAEQAAAEQAMAAEKQRLERRARLEQSFNDLRQESAQQYVQRQLADAETLLAAWQKYTNAVRQADQVVARQQVEEAAASEQRKIAVLEKSIAERLKLYRREQDAAARETARMTQDYQAAQEAKTAAAQRASQQKAEQDVRDLKMAKERSIAEANAILNQIEPKRELIALQQKLNALVAQGLLTQGQSNTFMAMQHRFEKGSRAASRYGLIMQQAGYQAQDFAVQVTSGTNAMVAFSQQASQMLGFFGAGGAIAGAIISTGILAYRLGTMGEAADKMQPRVRSLAEAVKAYNDELERGLKLRGVDTSNLPGKLADAQREREKAMRDTKAAQFLADDAAVGRMVNALGVKDGLVLSIVAGFAATFGLAKAETAAFEAGNKVIEAQNNALEGRLEKMREEYNLVVEQGEKEQERLSVLERQAQEIRKAEDARARAGDTTDEQRLKRIREDLYWLTMGGQQGTVEYIQKSQAEEDILRSLEQQASAIKDSLDPMREQLRLQEQLNLLVAEGKLTREQADRYLLLKRAKEREGLDIPVDAYARRGLLIGGTTMNRADTQTDELRKLNAKVDELNRTVAEAWKN